jgi:hypothetical protein
MTVMMGPRCLEWLFGFKTNEADGNRQGSEFFQVVMARHFSLLPSPLVGEGGSLTRSGSETDEGSLSAERTPHPALRATFSHKGRREETARLTDKSIPIQMTAQE